jgi:hypothetical protein
MKISLTEGGGWMGIEGFWVIKKLDIASIKAYQGKQGALAGLILLRGGVSFRLGY